MRIPTIFALLFLICLIVIGLFSYQRYIHTEKLKSIPIDNLKIINLTDTQATISWQTQTPTKTELWMSDSPTLKPNIWQLISQKLGYIQNGTNRYVDDRDGQTPTERVFHAVTLTNLNPQTTYYFSISHKNTLTNQSIEQFTTIRTPLSKAVGSDNTVPTPTLSGNVVDENFQPISDAVIFLTLEGSLEIGTTVNSSGNFLLPLTMLRNQDSETLIDLGFKTEATLKIIGPNNKESVINLALPLTTQILPPIILGQSYDLRNYSPNNVQGISTQNPYFHQPDQNPYDLNKDAKVDSIDLAEILLNIGPNPRNKEADLNQDTKVDEEDINLMKQKISE